MKISLLQPVLGTVSSRCAKKTVVRMTELVAARCPALWMWIASLVRLVSMSGSLSIIHALTQFITWFSCRAWSVRADMLYSAEVLERWLLVKARLVFDSTSGTSKRQRRDRTDLRCVYKVTCANCDKTYVGETGRKLGVRLQEHRTCPEADVTTMSSSCVRVSWH